MTIRLTLNYRASGAVVTEDFDTTVEARRALLAKAGGKFTRLGNGRIGSLVDRDGAVKASYTIESVDR